MGLGRGSVAKSKSSSRSSSSGSSSSSSSSSVPQQSFASASDLNYTPANQPSFTPAPSSGGGGGGGRSSSSSSSSNQSLASPSDLAKSSSPSKTSVPKSNTLSSQLQSTPKEFSGPVLPGTNEAGFRSTGTSSFPQRVPTPKENVLQMSIPSAQSSFGRIQTPQTVKEDIFFRDIERQQNEFQGMSREQLLGRVGKPGTGITGMSTPEGEQFSFTPNTDLSLGISNQGFSELSPGRRAKLLSQEIAVGGVRGAIGLGTFTTDFGLTLLGGGVLDEQGKSKVTFGATEKALRSKSNTYREFQEIPIGLSGKSAEIGVTLLPLGYGIGKSLVKFGTRSSLSVTSISQPKSGVGELASGSLITEQRTLFGFNLPKRYYVSATASKSQVIGNEIIGLNVGGIQRIKYTKQGVNLVGKPERYLDVFRGNVVKSPATLITSNSIKDTVLTEVRTKGVTITEDPIKGTLGLSKSYGVGDSIVLGSGRSVKSKQNFFNVLIKDAPSSSESFGSSVFTRGPKSSSSFLNELSSNAVVREQARLQSVGRGASKILADKSITGNVVRPIGISSLQLDQNQVQSNLQSDISFPAVASNEKVLTLTSPVVALGSSTKQKQRTFQNLAPLSLSGQKSSPRVIQSSATLLGLNQASLPTLRSLQINSFRSPTGSSINFPRFGVPPLVPPIPYLGLASFPGIARPRKGTRSYSYTPSLGAITFNVFGSVSGSELKGTVGTGLRPIPLFPSKRKKKSRRK